MIIDTLDNAEKYYCLHPLFERAFQYLNSIDLDSIEPGKYAIAGDLLKATVSDKAGLQKADAIEKFECHHAHIDIQLCIKGREGIRWKPRSSCIQEKGAYNQEKDVAFYGDAPDMYFELTNRQFAIFFAADVHAPMIGEGMIKKIVLKVKL